MSLKIPLEMSLPHLKADLMACHKKGLLIAKSRHITNAETRSPVLRLIKNLRKHPKN